MNLVDPAGLAWFPMDNHWNQPHFNLDRSKAPSALATTTAARVGIAALNALTGGKAFVRDTSPALAPPSIGKPVQVYTNHTNSLGIPGIGDFSYSITLGTVVIVHASHVGSASLLAHEYQHVHQWEALGDWMGPLHLLASTYSLATTGSYDASNPLECGPNASPPRPWP